MSFNHFLYQGAVATEYLPDGTCIYWTWDQNAKQVNSDGSTTNVPNYDRGIPGSCPDVEYGKESTSEQGYLASGNGNYIENSINRNNNGVGNYSLKNVPNWLERIANLLPSGLAAFLKKITPQWALDFFQSSDDLLNSVAGTGKKWLKIILVVCAIIIAIYFSPKKYHAIETVVAVALGIIYFEY